MNFNFHHVQVIDANKSIDDLHEELKEVVRNIITESKDTDLKKLWTDASEVSHGKRPREDHS